jgi:hypothetical protein
MRNGAYLFVLLFYCLEYLLIAGLLYYRATKGPQVIRSCFLAISGSISLNVIVLYLAFPLGFTVKTILLWPLVLVGILIPLPNSPHESGHFRSREVLLFCIVLLLTVGIFSLPFFAMSDGNAWFVTKTFYSDHMKHNAVTAALVPGTWPLKNPFLASEPLHYYWMAYLPGAALTKLTGVPVFEINRFIPLLVLALFISGSYSLVRSITRATPAILSIASLFFFSGWDWIYFFFDNEPLQQWIMEQPDLLWEWEKYRWMAPTFMNIERAALYLFPHLLSLTFFIASILFLTLHEEIDSETAPTHGERGRSPFSLALVRTTLSGVCLSTAMIASPVLALLFIPVVLVLCVWQPSMRLRRHVIAALALASALSFPSFLALKAARTASGEGTIGWNWALTETIAPSFLTSAFSYFWPFAYVLFEFGIIVYLVPPLLFSSSRGIPTKALKLLVVSSALSIVLFCIPGRIDLNIKHGILFKWASICLVGTILLDKELKVRARYLQLALLFIGAPTLMINLYTFVDTKDFTYYVSPSYKAAALWMNVHIPYHQVIQGDPDNPFISGVVGRPVALDNVHNARVFNISDTKASEVESRVLPALNSRNSSLIVEQLCSASANFLWWDSYKRPLKKLDPRMTIVFQNASGMLLSLECQSSPSQSAK